MPDPNITYRFRVISKSIHHRSAVDPTNLHPSYIRAHDDQPSIRGSPHVLKPISSNGHANHGSRTASRHLIILSIQSIWFHIKRERAILSESKPLIISNAHFILYLEILKITLSGATLDWSLGFTRESVSSFLSRVQKVKKNKIKLIESSKYSKIGWEFKI